MCLGAFPLCGGKDMCRGKHNDYKNQYPRAVIPDRGIAALFSSAKFYIFLHKTLFALINGRSVCFFDFLADKPPKQWECYIGKYP
jgi:hypothetical protein